MSYIITSITDNQSMKKLKQVFLMIMLCLLVFFITGCSSGQQTQAEQDKFQELTDEIFKTEVQSDSITLNYTLNRPENYGIQNFEPTLGHYTIDSIKEELAVSENYLAKLKEINSKQLTPDQQLTYKILKDYLSLETEGSDLLLYNEILSPTIGMQAQLPVLLAEYNLNTKKDIEDYLKILPCVLDYFKEIAGFEQEKSKAGFFMNDTTADSIIDQCSQFIKDPENNLLIEIFNNRIDHFEGITKEEKKAYKKSNKEAVLKSVVPAYQHLIDTLTALKGTGKNEGGLCGFPDGKKYYEYIIKSATGSDKSIAKINKLLDSTINVALMNMSKVSVQDPDIFEKFDSYEYSLTDPEEIINYLKEETKTDYPDLSNVNCNIKYVHKSLEDHLSPAFYLTPPIDNVAENNIYINGGEQFDLSKIFTTMAHEGYPGHLYQTVYFSQQQTDPIRYILSFQGYSEGWATYVEMDSYSIAGLDPNLAEMLMNNTVVSLCLYSKVDIGVNYYNWTLEKTQDYLKKFGIDDLETAKTLFDSMVAEPGNYVKYTLGYLEFKELREEAEKQLKDKFSAKEFHEFVLKTGPCQFYILKDQMKDWIKSVK